MLAYQRALKRYSIYAGKTRQHISILVLSVVIGIWGGLSAVLVKSITFSFHHWLTEGYDFGRGTYLFFALPFLGLILTNLFTNYVVRDNLSHGVSRVLYAISRRFGRIRNHNLFSSIIGSFLTITLGGSMGFEAPIILTGGAIGSFLGKTFHVNRKTLIILVGAGASGALAGIFKAPLASVVFSLEILMIDLTMASLIPLLIAAISGASMAYLLLGNDVLFSIQLEQAFDMHNLPYYIILGIFTGFVSLYFTRTTFFIEGFMERTFKRRVEKIMVAGIALGVMILAFPSLYGEGSEFLRQFINGDTSNLINNHLSTSSPDMVSLMLFMALIVLFKVIATSITSAGGGVGGIFSPSLFVGGVAGMFYAKLINLLPWVQVPEKNMALVGMTGVMAGVMHAPLTGILLVAEFTGSYGMMTPLIFTAIFSYLTITLFEKHSVYTKQLAMRGELMTHHKDKAVLQMMRVSNLIETNFKTISSEASLGDLVKVLSTSERNVVAVVDEENTFQGIIFLNDIRNIIFRPELYDKIGVDELMYMPSYLVDPDDSMEEVAAKFNDSGNYNLPVIKNEKYLGFVSRARVFSNYRKLLSEFSDE
ncbi:MAG: chloride channel protein [Bacteroidales bacterium]|nr:chloride channel protein [Bacteroidales bacterium]